MGVLLGIVEFYGVLRVLLGFMRFCWVLWGFVGFLLDFRHLSPRVKVIPRYDL